MKPAPPPSPASRSGPAGPLVIFDCDGVLVDSEGLVAEAEAELLAGLGVTLSPEQISEQFAGLSEADVAARIEAEWGVTLDERFSRAKREVVTHLLCTQLQPVAGIAGVLAGLGTKVCVASSSSPERVAISLQSAGLAGYFGDNVFSATMVSRGKPAPDLFLLAARTMGAPPELCVVVEDSPFGVAAARAAGMDVIGFTGAGHSGPGSRQRLARAGATEVASDAAELGAMLGAALSRLGDRAVRADNKPGG